MAGQEAENCCALIGGDYLENRYFGEGIGLVTRQEDAALARALDDRPAAGVGRREVHRAVPALLPRQPVLTGLARP